jgi:acyl carrier protein
MNRANAFEEISRAMVEMFELDPKTVTPEALLVEELGLDSIDAVDLAAKLYELTGKRLTEKDLRNFRSVVDVVSIVVDAPPSGQDN